MHTSRGGIVIRSREQWHGPFEKLAAGAIELFCHTVMLVLILAAVRVIEWTLEHLWGTKEKLFSTSFQ